MWTFQYKHGDRPLDGYTILRAAGRGGFGEVYQAVSDGGREVALKAVLGYEQIELRGIGHCMNLKGPHLVTVFDVVHNAAGRPFVVMEYIAGPSLRQLIDESPAGLGPQKAAFFLREIAKGLTYLHDCGIVHRDLKPGNIFYENGYVKIGDYGLSKAMATSPHSGQTVTVGTVHYMAPEIGAGKYDRGVDIYALGAVLYEMLTGTVPYLGASPAEVLLKHLSAEPDVAGVPQPFAAVIQKAMAKDPAQRYGSVQEMVEAVFGADHVRQSVSVFRPEELSVVAERVAMKVAVGAGAGAAAAGGGGRAATGGSSAMAGGPAAAGDFWQRLGNLVDRAVYDEGAAPPQPKQVPPPGGRVLPTPPPLPPAAADPLPWRQRRNLAVLVSAAVAVAAGILSAESRNGPFPPLVFTLGGIWAGIFGIGYGIPRLSARFQGINPRPRRLLNGALVAAAVLVGTLPGLFLFLLKGFRGDDPMPGTWLGVFVALVVANGAKWAEANRPARMHFGRVGKTVFVAFVVSLVFGGHPVLAVAVAGGLCMAVQVMSPWNPAAANFPRPSGRRQVIADEFKAMAADWRAGRAVAEPHEPPPAPMPVIPYPPVPSGDRGREVPPFVGLLWLAGVVVFVTGGALALVAAGVSSQPRDFAPLVATGVAASVTGAFCFVNLFRRRFRGWWSYLVRPVLMLLCVQSALVSLLVLANLNHVRDEEAMIGAFFIIFPAVLLLALLFAPARLFSRHAEPAADPGLSPHNPAVVALSALLLFGFAGGIHRLVVGKTKTGILWLLTLGLLGVGQTIDFILILTGNFTDAQGRRVASPFAPAAAGPPVPVPPAAPPPVPHEAAMAPRAEAPLSPPAAPATTPRRTPAGSPIRTAVAGGGLLLILLAVLLSLAAAVLPALVMANVIDGEPARELRYQQAHGRNPLLLAYQIGTLASVVVWLAGAAILVTARRSAGVLHLSRGAVGAAGMILSLLPFHATVQNNLFPYRGRAASVMTPALPLPDGRYPFQSIQYNYPDPNDPQVASDAVARLLGLNVTLPAAFIFFASTLVLAWPARRAGGGESLT